MYVYVLNYTELWDVLICLDSAAHSLMCLSVCVGGGQLRVRKRINIFNRPVLWRKRQKEMEERERDFCFSFLVSDRLWQDSKGSRICDLWCSWLLLVLTSAQNGCLVFIVLKVTDQLKIKIMS